MTVFVGAEYSHDGPVVVGRQSVERNDPPPVALIPPGGGEQAARLVVAGYVQEGVSRKAVLREQREKLKTVKP